MTKEGVIAIEVQKHRSQKQNRKQAISKRGLVDYKAAFLAYLSR